MGEIINKGLVRQPYFFSILQLNNYIPEFDFHSQLSTYPSTTEYYSASDFSAHTSSLAGYLHSHG